MELRTRRKKNGVPIVSAEILNRFATGILDDYDQKLIKYPQAIEIIALAEEYFNVNVKLMSLTGDCSIMGITSFEGGEINVFDAKNGTETISVEPRTILLESALMDGTGRGRFAAAHETAHIALHGRVNLNKDNKSDIQDDFRKQIICIREQELQTDIDGDKKNDTKWLEWQANYLGAALLMPEGPFRMVVDEYIKQEGIGGTFCMNHPLEYNRIMQDNIAVKTSQVFATSKTATYRRMRALGYVVSEGVVLYG